ncbi:hypothetical protein [Deinococcus navajonensis]|uniref:Uncharacterized protein n=1 Tax=Deinococcus navajonensis TaxID=309884 RepID=A0ABV8XTN9_9DEIO
MLIKDCDEQLAALLQALRRKAPVPAVEAQLLLNRTLNWLTFGLNVLARGERIRALELLWLDSRQSAAPRLSAGRPHLVLAHPSRLAEQRLPAALLERYHRLTGSLDQLEDTYAEALSRTEGLAGALGLLLPEQLWDELRQMERDTRFRSQTKRPDI